MKQIQLFFLSIAALLISCVKPCIKDPVDLPPPTATCLSWNKLLGGTSADEGYAVVKTTDNGYIVTGSTYSADGDIAVQHGKGDVNVIKINSLGVKVWQKTFGGPDEEMATSIVAAPDGGYVILGIQSIGSVNRQLWIIKIDELGNKLWEQVWLGPGYTTANAILASGNEYIIAADCSNSTDVEPWLVKLDLDGNILLQKEFGHSTRYEFPNSIIPGSDGGYLITGFTIDGAGEDAWIAKVDLFGNLEWEKFLSGSDIDEFMDVVPCADGTGEYIVVGQSTSTDGDIAGNHGSFDILVARINVKGNTVWRKLLGGTSEEQARSILRTQEGAFVIAGITSSTNGDVTGPNAAVQNRGAWIIKLNKAGGLLAQKVLGGSLEDHPGQVIPAGDCGYLMVGYSMSNNGDLSGNHKENVADMWLSRFSL